VPRNGVSVSTTPFTFGNPALPTTVIAGRAVFDFLDNLLLVLPHATPRPIPGGGPIDALETGSLFLSFAALAPYLDGAGYSGSIAAGAQAGSCWDVADILGPGSTVSAGGTLVPRSIASAPMTAGVGLAINMGQLRAAGAFVA
jgi:hypothetical protein